MPPNTVNCSILFTICQLRLRIEPNWSYFLHNRSITNIAKRVNAFSPSANDNVYKIQSNTTARFDPFPSQPWRFSHLDSAFHLRSNLFRIIFQDTINAYKINNTAQDLLKRKAPRSTKGRKKHNHRETRSRVRKSLGNHYSKEAPNLNSQYIYFWPTFVVHLTSPCDALLFRMLNVIVFEIRHNISTLR